MIGQRVIEPALAGKGELQEARYAIFAFELETIYIYPYSTPTTTTTTTSSTLLPPSSKMQFTRILLCIFAALFSLAVAAPTGGERGVGRGGNGGDTTVKTVHEYCSNMKQEFKCCDSSTISAGAVNPLSAITANCNIVGASVASVPILSGGENCKGSMACCSGNSVNQAGLVNVAAPQCTTFQF
ncbi:hypothetical protein HOY82DRAFT_595427 [Tuber indicum]|nr:hypothetical protein HOY82DRAFT_595427 [Tuber indicum]